MIIVSLKLATPHPVSRQAIQNAQQNGPHAVFPKNRGTLLGLPRIRIKVFGFLLFWETAKSGTGTVLSSTRFGCIRVCYAAANVIRNVMP